MALFEGIGSTIDEEERRRRALMELAAQSEAAREATRLTRGGFADIAPTTPVGSSFADIAPEFASETRREDQRIFRGPSVEEQQETRREAMRDARMSAPSVFRGVSTVARTDPRAGGYTLPEYGVPDFSPGLRAVERGLSPEGDPDLPGPLRLAGQIAGKALELTPFPAKARLDAEREGRYTYQNPDDKQADQFALMPGIGAAGTVFRGAKKVAPKVAPKVADAVLDAEQLAARIGATSRAQRGVADDLARQVAERAKTAETPGFLKTAEEKVRENASRTVSRVAEDASVANKAETGVDLGYNPAKFATLDADVQKVIQQEAENAGGFATQRRGVQTIAAIDERSLGVETERIRNTPIGQAMNAEELRAAARATAKAATRRKALQDEVQAAGGPEHASAELKTRLMLAAVDQASLQRAFAGGRTEAGRALRVLREELTAADVNKSKDSYDRALAVIGGRENQDQFIKRLNDLWSRNVPDAVKDQDTYRFLSSIGQAKTSERINEYWINSILSSPITHEVNMIGNAAFAAMQPPTRFLAAGVEAATTLGGRTRPREVFFSESGALAAGMLRGISVGARKAVYIVRNGYAMEDVARFTESGRMGRPQAIGGTLGNVVNMPTRFLGAEDAVFKAMGQTSELYAQAARTASREKLSGKAFAQRVAELVATPTDEMMDAATKQAKYVTFQSEPGKTTATVMKLRDTFPPLRFVIPFIQTPTNLAKRGLEYSPAGVISAIRSTGAERSTAIARAAIGSAVMGFMASKMVTGEMTADAPKTPAERDEFYRSGKIPYAVRIGDQWVEFRRLEPMMTPVRYMAAMYQQFQNSGGQWDWTAAGPVMGAFLGGLKDASYLQGIENLMNAVEDPGRFGERFLTGIAGGFTPFSAAVRSVANATDPVQRDPGTPLERLAVGIPGLSQNVPPRLSAYGEQVRREDSRQGVGAVLNPLKVSAVRNDPVDTEIATIRSQGYELKALGFVSDKLAGQKLSSDEQRRWQELAGQTTYDVRKALIASPEYQSLPWGEKAKAIERASDKAKNDEAALRFGTEMAMKAAAPEDVARGAMIALHSRDDNVEKAAFVAGLQEADRLTPTVRQAIDRSWGTTYEVRPKAGGIVDGDTIKLEDPPGLARAPGQRDSYRLLRVDTPEKTEPGYARAKAALDNLLAGAQKLEIRTKKTDAFGRYLVELIADGVNVSDWLVENGYSKYNKPSKDDPVSTDALLEINRLASQYRSGGPAQRALIQKLPLWPLMKDAVDAPKSSTTPKPATAPSGGFGPFGTPRPSAAPSGGFGSVR